MRIEWMLTAGALCLGLPEIAQAEATASFEPSRTTGVAPLAVFFDAGASTCEGCEGVVHPWHDLAYRWDFGDPDAGTWDVSGRSKARDIGPSAAHVYEQPGHYVVTLTTTDPVSGTTSTTTREIDVDDPDEVFAADNTLCYRASEAGDFTGCPAGAQQKTMASFTEAFADCKGSEHRCLFRRGDTFTAATTITLDASAPTTVGAFGDGTRPIVNATGLGMAPLFQGGADGDDYRIMDLSLIGPKAKGSMVYGAKRTQSNALWLRIEAVADTWHNFVEMEQSKLAPKGWHEHIFIVECSVLKAGFGAGGNIMFVTYKQSAVLGNDFQDTRKGEHILRAGAYDNLLIAHNRLGAAAGIRSVVTLRSPDSEAPCEGGVCAPSKRGHLHANTFHITNGWTVQVCGQAEMQAQQCEDTVVDGNFAFLNPAYPLNTDPIVVFNLADGDTVSRRTSFRNNICNLTDAVNHCADLKMGTLARAFNNTCYRSDDGPIECVHGVGMTPDGVSTLAQNNLAFTSGAGKVNVVTGSWSVSNHNVKPASDPFISPTPGADPTQYQLAIGSEAIDGGTPVASGFDFAALPRLAGDAVDLGAWEFGAMEPTEPLEVTISGPATAEAGVGFNLEATVIGGTGAATLTWDCDGDGSFETDTAAVTTAVCPGLPAATYTLAVRATDESGTADDSLTLMVDEACESECTGETGPDLPTTSTGAGTTGDPGETVTPTSGPATSEPTSTTPVEESSGNESNGDSLGAEAGGDSPGCGGCRTTPHPAGAAFLALLLLLRRRRGA